MKELIDKAFDYRGDVTVDINDGTSIEGFLFNRSFEGNALYEEGFIELIRTEDGETARIGIETITGIRFTGKDCAAT